MLPASGLMKPSHISTVVVLPAPLGPSSASTSAAWTSRSSSDTAVVDPYRLLTPRRRTGTADERSRDEPTARESEVTGIQRMRQAWQAAVPVSTVRRSEATEPAARRRRAAWDKAGGSR